jgi:hypothetical protein
VIGLTGWGIVEPEKLKQLEALPLEQRLILSSNLERFDLLLPEEQAKIRTLDAQLSKLDPVIQARYLSIMRRYRSWLSKLSPARKSQFDKAASLDAKLALIESFRKTDKESNADQGALVLANQPGDLGAPPPIEMANAINAWFHLDEAERARIKAIPSKVLRLTELLRISWTQPRGNGQIRRLQPREEEELRAEIDKAAPLGTIFPGLQKKLDLEKAEGKRPNLNGLRNPVHHLAESLYYLKHPPLPVTSANLALFEAEIPEWLRESLDPMPPLEARRRLTSIYRLIYPGTSEFKPFIREKVPANAAPTKPKPPATKGQIVF